MTTRFTYTKTFSPPKLQVNRVMPIKEVFGVGPGYAFVQYAAVMIKSDNDRKYAVGG